MTKTIRKNKQAIPTDALTMICFRMSKSLHRLVKVRAAEKQLSLQEVIINALEHWLDHS